MSMDIFHFAYGGFLADSVDSDLAESVTPGVLGFLVIFSIAVALYFLMRSMHRNMSNVDFSEEPRASSGGAARPEAEAEPQEEPEADRGGADGEAEVSGDSGTAAGEPERRHR